MEKEEKIVATYKAAYKANKKKRKFKYVTTKDPYKKTQDTGNNCNKS